MHQTRQMVQAHRKILPAGGIMSDNEDDEMGYSAYEAMQKSEQANEEESVEYRNGGLADEEQESREESCPPFPGGENGDDETESDDEYRRSRDDVFPKIAAYVKHNAAMRKHGEQPPGPVVTEPSRRQRTSATVAAMGLNGAETEPPGPDKPTRRRYRRREATMPSRKRGRHESLKQPSSDEPKKPTARRGRPRRQPIVTEPPLSEKPPPPTPAKSEPAVRTAAGHKALVRFVRENDAPLPPEAIIECDRRAPPFLPFVAVAIFDPEGKLIRLRGGAEVRLEISVNGKRSPPLVCTRPFSGGKFYFSNLNYTSNRTGLWSMRLSAKWTSAVNKKKMPPIDPDTHVCEVHFRGDKRLSVEDGEDGGGKLAQEEENALSSSPPPPRRQRFVWSEAQVEACRTAYVDSKGDLNSADVEALAATQGLSPSQILQRFAYFERHGSSATPPKEFLDDATVADAPLPATRARRRCPRKRANPLRGGTLEELRDLGRHPNNPTPVRQWFLHDPNLYVGATIVIFDKESFQNGISDLVNSLNEFEQPDSESL